MTSPIRVLLVDADDDAVGRVRGLVAAMTTAVEMERAATFGEGLARMTASHRFDAFLVAGRLGAGSGVDLLRAYRASGGEAPVLLISDEPARSEDLAAMEAGAADYLERGRLEAALLERRLRYAVAASRRAEVLREVRDELETRVAERADALQTMNAALVAEVADRRAAERALREADRRKDEFLAMLAHELRNPLAPLTSGVEILTRTSDAPENADRRGRALRVIERQVAQMVRLIGDLIDVSRITHGKLELQREQVSLETVVDSALETARPLLLARRHEFALALPEEPISLHVDPMRLAQVLANLLSNAAKYTEPGGRVRLAASREGDDLVVAVSDSGIGIPPSHLAHVFTMFGQGQRAHDPVHGGLGIGLALARSIVEMHGGRLTAASGGEGKGSVFSLRIPCVAAAPVASNVSVPSPAAEAPPEEPPRPLRILVVDDNVEAALTLAELLTLQGHETHVAHDGPAGVDAARHLRPDVAIFDLGLPGFDGLEAARRVRADPQLSGVLLLALSGWVQEADRKRSREAGFAHHLAKPVQLRTLEPLLREVRSGPLDRVRTP